MVSSSELEFDLDSRVAKLEFEWHCAFEDNVRARAEYHALAANPGAILEDIDRAREMYERSEAGKNQVLDKIDRLERRMARRC